MNVLLIGPPGSGKGTQGERLAARYGIEHLATGDLLRAEVVAETPLGVEVRETMDRGNLVPDETIVELVMPKVIAAAKGAGYLLDGFPRTVEQAEQARRLADDPEVAPDAVVYLEVGRDELVRRILARAETEGRSDDNSETVANRLHVYDEVTSPLVEHYRDRGLLVTVDAALEPDAVTAAIVAALPSD
jgi:adenylate kinase